MIDNKQLLEEVRAHWKENLQKAKDGSLGLIDIVSPKCAFCTIYKLGECAGCPISEITDCFSCVGTPWHGVYFAIGQNHQRYEIIIAVEQMCSFLDKLNV